jgi:hypothetical protein
VLGLSVGETLGADEGLVKDGAFVGSVDGDDGVGITLGIIVGDVEGFIVGFGVKPVSS